MIDNNEYDIKKYVRSDWIKYCDLLIEKCKQNNITYQVGKSSFIDEEYISVELPNGRIKRKINFWLDDIPKLLELPFEKYTFISDYEAICDYSSGYLECIFESLNGYSSYYSIYKTLFGKDPRRNDDNAEDEFKITLSDSTNSGTTIEISRVSEVLNILSQTRSRGRKQLSLKIYDAKFIQHDIASSSLEKIANSLFFQIDLIKNLPFALCKHTSKFNRPKTKKLEDDIPNIQFPKNEYYEVPISLYWYARSAIRMPLLQFLAFYQSIEYFFPIYSQEDAKRKIKYILKDESFRTERDSDIMKILISIKSNSANTFGDERSQLRATLLECIDPVELHSYLTETEERKEFFSKIIKGITKHKIPLNNEKIDLRNEIVERIYDIRCKIVHTKIDSKDAEIDFLLPFSKEAELLYNDIELIHFLARKVLIASSIKLVI